MIIWWSKHVGVILSVLVCDIWINVVLQTGALVGPLYIVNWNARWNSETTNRIWFFWTDTDIIFDSLYFTHVYSNFTDPTSRLTTTMTCAQLGTKNLSCIRKERRHGAKMMSLRQTPPSSLLAYKSSETTQSINFNQSEIKLAPTTQDNEQTPSSTLILRKPVQGSNLNWTITITIQKRQNDDLAGFDVQDFIYEMGR
jgi:hypothetical protein